MTAQVNVVVYTKSACPNCDSAKQLLDDKSIPYEVRDMDDPHVRFAFTEMHPDIRQMPQIFINDQRVGGIAGLRVALEQL